MSGMIERFPGWPALPDLFGWAEAGFPGTHTLPGPHGIRVEEHSRTARTRCAPNSLASTPPRTSRSPSPRGC